MASMLDLSPDQLLALRAHNDSTQEQAAAGPPAVNWDRMQLPPMDPGMQGPRGPSQVDSAPAVAMAPAAMPQGAMAPTQDPPSGGFNLSDILQGGGIGQDTSHDSEIDPDYGISRGAIRRANNRSMFNSGLLLLAAGAARDDGARASILSNLPATMDNSNQLQNFSRTRLEVAKAKLATAQAAQTASQDAAWQKQLDGYGQKFGGAQAPVGGVAAPVQPLASATAAPGAVSAPAVPAAGAQPAPAVASATPPQDAPAPGAVPAGPAPMELPKPGTVFPSAPPPKLDRPPELAAGYQPKSMADVNLLRGMTREKAAEYIQQQTTNMQSQEYPGQPFLDPTTSTLMQPIYKNGVLLHSTPLGQESSNARIVQDAQGNYRSQKLRQDGSVADDSFVTPESQKQANALSEREFDLVKTNAADLKSRYAQLQDVPQKISRAQIIMKNIDDGKVTVGPGATSAQYAGNVLSNLGWANKDEIDKLSKTSDAKSMIGQISATIARANNRGGQITDSDQKLAEGIAGGLDNPQVLKEALGRYVEDQRNEVNLYNSDADGHTAELKRTGLGSGLLRARRIDGSLGDSSTKPAYATSDVAPSNTPVGAPAPAPAPAPVALSPRDKLRAAMATGGGAAPVPTAQAAPKAPPVAGAKLAPDGKWYVKTDKGYSRVDQ